MRTKCRHVTKVFTLIGLTVSLTAAVPLAAGAQSAPHRVASRLALKVVARDKYGKILVSESGATLYAYSPDGKNKPTCTGACASIWPPLTVAKGTKATGIAKGIKDVALIKVAGGKEQVAVGGHPLYRYSGDTHATVKGEGIGGIWYVLASNGTTVKAQGSTGSSTATTNGSAYSY